MNSIKKIIVSIFFISFLSPSLVMAHDILLEAKGSVFVPTDALFRDLYGNCGVFAVEMTSNMFDQWYVFTSVDFLIKNGQTVTIETPSKIDIVNIGFGAKYFMPFQHGDFYVGLGIEPTYVKIANQLSAVDTQTNWSCGGVAKIGVIVDLPRSLFLDFFFDYSFVKSTFYTSNPTQTNITHLDGCLFGLGFGYRFN